MVTPSLNSWPYTYADNQNNMHTYILTTGQQGRIHTYRQSVRQTVIHRGMHAVIHTHIHEEREDNQIGTERATHIHTSWNTYGATEWQRDRGDIWAI